MLEQPLTGAHRCVGTASLTWRTLRTFLRCYDNPHGKDEMKQRMSAWKWGKTVPETLAIFNEMVHIWTQEAQQTDIYQGRRVWVVTVADEVHDSQG